MDYRKVVDALADVVKELNKHGCGVSADASAAAVAAVAAAAEHSASADRGRMQIRVQINSVRTIPLDVNPTDTIRYLKATLQQKEGFRPDRQALIFAGKKLVDDAKSLQNCGIRSGSNVYIVG